MAVSSLILPFAVAEKRRKNKLDSNMELAAILCLAEAKRKKHALINASTEKISFLSKLHYPMWAVPWENGSLIIDGLQNLSSTLSYWALPDTESFLNDLERGQSVREQFRSALEKHADTFSSFSETVYIPVKTIVADKTFLSEVSEYVEETLALKADVTGQITLVSPKLDEDAAREKADKVFHLYQRVHSDIKGLQHVAHLLNETLELHAQRILREIELANETFKKQLDSVTPSVDKKVEVLLRERDACIQKMKKAAEAELTTKLREKERRQREMEKLELRRTEYKSRHNAARKRKRDKVGIARWEQSLRICEKRIAEVKQRISNLSSYSEKMLAQSQEDMDKVRYSYQSLIERERRKLIDIEVAKDAAISAKGKENVLLRMMTTRIISQIERLEEQKKQQASELMRLTIPWKPEKVALLAVPFCLAVYKAGEKLRLGLFAPLQVMSSEGIVKKIEKTLLSFSFESRVNLLLQARSKALSRMFDAVLHEKVEADNNLRQSLQNLAISNNFLANADFRKATAAGIKDLEAEGWVKQEEAASLVKIYA